MSGRWKYCVLFLNSFLVVGQMFASYLPVALQDDLVRSRSSSPKIAVSDNTTYDVSYQTTYGASSDNTTHVHLNKTDYLAPVDNTTDAEADCGACLGMGEVRYNLLGAGQRWSTAAMCLPSGYIIDRLGNSRSAILFTMLPFLGSVLFAVSAVTSPAPITTAMFVLMLTGCIIIGLSIATLDFLQARVVAVWFPDDAMMSIAVSYIGYLGVPLAFFLPALMEGFLGFPVVASLGAIICGLGVICALCMAFLLEKNQRSQGVQDRKRVSLRDLRLIPRTYWLFVLLGGIPPYTYVTNLPMYIQLRYGYTKTDAMYISGCIWTPVIFTPVWAGLLKKVDCNGILLTVSVLTLISALTLLAFVPSVHPLLPVLMVGTADTSIMLLIFHTLVVISPELCVGTMSGIYFTWRHCLSAFTMVAAGYILQTDHPNDVYEQLRGYDKFFWLLIGVLSFSVVCGVILNTLDIRDTCLFNQRLLSWKESRDETKCLTEEPSEMYESVEMNSSLNNGRT